MLCEEDDDSKKILVGWTEDKMITQSESEARNLETLITLIKITPRIQTDINCGYTDVYGNT